MTDNRRWIEAEENTLPKDEHFKWIALADGTVTSARYIEAKKIWMGIKDIWSLEEVTHWMPKELTPPAPKKQPRQK